MNLEKQSDLLSILTYPGREELSMNTVINAGGILTGNTDYTHTRIVKGFVNKKYLDIG